MKLPATLFLIATALVAAEPEFFDVFPSTSEGYVSVRIPAVLVTKAGSVLAFAEGTTPGRLLHSGPDSTKRERGTIALSTDEGKTWPTKRVLHAGPFAYSVLTRFADGTVGCLFEADNYARLVFARFPIEWVSAKP